MSSHFIEDAHSGTICAHNQGGYLTLPPYPSRHPMSADTHLHWTQQDGSPASALWRSEAAVPAPRRVQLVDDTTPADKAYKLACEGTGLLWTGDFQNARHLLQALTRRLDKTAAPKRGAANKRDEPPHAGLAFHQHRQRLAHRARILGMQSQFEAVLGRQRRCA